MTAAQAAEALGVRPATIYAYVSRGVLRRTTTLTSPGQRVSVFDRGEVLALAEQRGRPRAGVIATLVESDVTSLDARGRLAFRGHDVVELATREFEEAVAVLWQEEPAAPWDPVPQAWADAVAGLRPRGHVLPQDRVLLAVMAAATGDLERADLRRDHVLAVARGAIQLAVEALGGRPGSPVAQGLWWATTGREPSDDQRRTMSAALIALMDHELAASTLAARVAASTHADPWMCLLAGLATMRGPRHGAASSAAAVVVRAWLAEGTVPDTPAAGFGHKVYLGTDPRATLILGRLEQWAPDVVLAVDRLAVEMMREHSVMPNVDLALAALSVAADLPEGASESLFMVARMAGFAAHVLEEYPHGLRYRPRAVGSV